MKSLMICVNNPDNGVYRGRLAWLRVDDFMDLEPTVFPEPRCTLKGNTFSVHRCTMKFKSHAQHIDDSCCDVISVSDQDAARLVASMLAVKRRDDFIWRIGSAYGEAAIGLSHRRRSVQTIAAAEVLAAMEAS